MDIKLVPQFSGLTEYWIDIKGYEGLYQINNFGRVKSLVRKNRLKEKILKNRNNGQGYLKLPLSKNNKTKQHYIHRLLSTAFIANPNNLPIINHIDGNKLNNTISNLEWCDYKLNIQHAVNNELRKYGRSNRQPKLTKQQVKEIRKLALTTTLSQVEIGAKYNISPSQVSNIKTGRCWQHLFV